MNTADTDHPFEFVDLAAEQGDQPEAPTYRIVGTWLTEVVGDCTCGVGSPWGHEPGCGLEPVINLTTLPGWDDLKTHLTA